MIDLIIGFVIGLLLGVYAGWRIARRHWVNVAARMLKKYDDAIAGRYYGWIPPLSKDK